MEIKSTSSYATTGVALAVSPNNIPQVMPQVMPQDEWSVKNSSSSQVSEELGKTGDADLSTEKLENITDGLNDFMQYLNTNLKFVLHQKTDRLIVQIVDIKSQKVLKEAPPREILDVVAKIHDLVGALIDQKI
ncbi:flagellar protein FlaG [Sporomusa sp. KB1]|jgi:flagellar protein FlaG|uniref:flagellar protein FlaG n=1 Tax=Sporomusa sp. KB1 TaxID=943346 RepID=UPI00119CE2EB|nr:flagellar protein FlaG [Sporomusa sp. KB1]TWH45238.1 flagellar protein FlaG [Sporomusa sp. KB1]